MRTRPHLTRIVHIALLSAIVFLSKSSALAQSRLSISNSSAAPGASIIVPIHLTSYASDSSGLQFELQYDSSVMNVTAVAGQSTRLSEKDFRVSDLGPGRKRFVVIGLNQSRIQDGPVVNLSVGLSPGAPEGSYTLTLGSLVSTDPYGRPGTLSGSDGVITVRSSADAARLRPEGVLNAASLLPGPVAPGEIVALVGSGLGPAPPQAAGGTPPTLLGGTAVLIGGSAASLLYAASDQVNVILPAQFASTNQAQMQVFRDDQKLADLAVPPADSAPGIFTLGATGAGPAIALNADSTLNSADNPAAKGSVLTLLGTGGGAPEAAFAAAVRIGGLQAQVTSIDQIAGGIVLVSSIVPVSVPSGHTVPVVLTIGGSSSNSQAGVSVAIRPDSDTGAGTAAPDQPNPCDSNGDGKLTPADAEAATAMVMGFLPCTADLDGTGTCTVISAQRVINAVSGGACLTGAAPNPHSVSLNWTSGDPEIVIGYNVYRSTSSEGPYRTVNTSILTSASYTDISVQAGQTYYYVVTAVDSYNAESAFSSGVTVTVPAP